MLSVKVLIVETADNYISGSYFVNFFLNQFYIISNGDGCIKKIRCLKKYYCFLVLNSCSGDFHSFYSFIFFMVNLIYYGWYNI